MTVAMLSPRFSRRERQLGAAVADLLWGAAIALSAVLAAWSV